MQEIAKKYDEAWDELQKTQKEYNDYFYSDAAKELQKKLQDAKDNFNQMRAANLKLHPYPGKLLGE